VSTDNGDERAGEDRPAADLEAQREAVEEFLGGLVTAFGRPEAAVSVAVVEDGVLEADVSGEELGLLVGPKGQTLQSVQELIRSMVQRRFVGEAHARVRVDIAGYRQRRREALERFTRTVAEQVLSTGRAKVLDPMLAGDRKVVHDVANEIEGIVTRSEGEDPGRRVIIQPA
jgi:spoIIIJ-associated protein